MVRSKSELIIADKLYFYNVPFRYEEMLYIENHSFSPDFTIFTPHGLFYWEHCGLMEIPKYRSSNEWKLKVYRKAGIVPWKNLIITYDAADGGINSAQIENEIVNRLL